MLCSSLLRAHQHRFLPSTKSITITRSSLLSFIDRCRTLQQLKQVQAQLILSGLITDPLAASRLIAFSASLNLAYCASILTNLSDPNIFSFNAAIRAFADSSCPIQSVEIYKILLFSSSRPDDYTYPFLLKACSKISDVGVTGNKVFGHVLQMGFDANVFVSNAAMHMLANSGSLGDARKVFDGSLVRDLVSWNTMINGYVQRGFPTSALQLFRDMEAEGIDADEVTMIGVILCCSQLEDLELGRKFHQLIEDKRLNLTVPLTNAIIDMHVKCRDLKTAKALFDSMPKRSVVSWTTMVVGYAKFGMLADARKVFDDMPEKDVVPWNALIAGYVQDKRGKEALDLFHEMQAADVQPDEVTMVSLLSACSQLGALEMGMWLHRYIDRHKLRLNVALGTALVDMYAKCGNIEKSLQVFQELPERNALTWTSIICSLASHGHARAAIDHFLKMLELGLAPDDVTFLGVLSACCHAGLVENGRTLFSEMSSKYKLHPEMKHYSCMVDLLGRAGLLSEAESLIETMPMKPDAVLWGSLFFACRTYGHVALGEHAALKLLELDPNDSGIYVLLANMYVEANMRDKADKVRFWMRKMGVEKTPGCSLIEVNGVVNEFIVRDEAHPLCKEIYLCVFQLARHMARPSPHDDSHISWSFSP